MTIYEKSVKYFGVKAQFDKANEELLELGLAIHHFQDAKIDLKGIATEIADVEIMCAQLRVIIGEEIVNAEKAIKLSRLRELMAGNTFKVNGVEDKK
jgi:NTP pyrophosphatase (non-canonical NTP hydrolase)